MLPGAIVASAIAGARILVVLQDLACVLQSGIDRVMVKSLLKLAVEAENRQVTATYVPRYETIDAAVIATKNRVVPSRGIGWYPLNVY